MKTLSIVFSVLAVALSDAMCAVVAYNWCDMLWGRKYAIYGAPAWTALFWAFPFIIAIMACVLLAVSFKRVTK